MKVAIYLVSPRIKVVGALLGEIRSDLVECLSLARDQEVLLARQDEEVQQSWI